MATAKRMFKTMEKAKLYHTIVLTCMFGGKNTIIKDQKLDQGKG